MLRHILTSLALLIAAPSVQAATVTANATIDLSQAITANVWNQWAHPLDAEVTVRQNDRVVIDIDFAPGQALSWGSESYFQPFLMLTGYATGLIDPAQTSNYRWSNTVLTFNNLTEGTQIGSVADGYNGSLHIGPTYEIGADFVRRTFTGVTVAFDVLYDQGDMARNYDTVGFQFERLFRGSVALVETDVAPVPLPAGLWLLASALGVLALRRMIRAA